MGGVKAVVACVRELAVWFGALGVEPEIPTGAFLAHDDRWESGLCLGTKISWFGQRAKQVGFCLECALRQGAS